MVEGDVSEPSDAGACVLVPIIALPRASEVGRNVGILAVLTSTMMLQESELKQGTSAQHLALIRWRGGAHTGLERVALSALHVHPSGMASAGQVDSSSEETSSSSNETDVEVIATILKGGSLETFNPPGAWLHKLVGSDQISKCVRVTGSWKG